jgi:uncharacterized protein (TIGR02118 family)
MVKISILYPNRSGARFDFDYYIKRYIPRSVQLLSTHPGFRGVSVERGTSGPEPGLPPAYLAACFFTFDTADSFFAAFTPNAAELQADRASYTDIAPQIQINEILIGSTRLWPNTPTPLAADNFVDGLALAF